MSRIGSIPAWWLTLTGWTAGELLPLLDKVERMGVSKNDKTAVTRIWRQQQIAWALRNQVPKDDAEPPPSGTG